MIKIMIVDDEQYVRTGIKETIDWTALEMQIVAEASSYNQAFDLFAKLEPDIVITDIRMKSKNGLELISKLSQYKANTEFIIISGYDSFEYAHSAIKQNVKHYLLKPINNNELINALIACKERIEEKQYLDITVKNYIQFQRKNFLLDILDDNNLTKDTINQYCNSYNIHLPSNLYIVAILKFASEGNTEIQNYKLMTHLRDSSSYFVSFSDLYIISAEIYNQIILIAFHRTNSDDAKFNKLLKNIKETFESCTEEKLSIGKSGIFRNLVIIKRAYQQALQAVTISTYNNSHPIVNYTQKEEIYNHANIIDDKFIHQFLDALHNTDKNKLQTMIYSCFEHINIQSDNDLSKFKESVLTLVLSILNEVIVDTNSMILIFGKALTPAFDIQNANTTSQLKRSLLFIINKLLTNEEVKLIYRSRPIIKNTILYIMKHHAKKIKVQDISDELFISPFHLMREFKKATGHTLNSFLTEYRIKSAIALIQSGNYKVYEVGSLVGYDNPDYFCRVFKQITGHTPTYYSTTTEENSTQNT